MDESNLSTSTATPNAFFCNFPWTSFKIHDHKGNVNPCCWSKVTCGNVNQGSISDIWNGEGFVEMRTAMVNGDLDSICASDCPYRLGDMVQEPETEPTDVTCRDNWLLQQREIQHKEIVLESKPTHFRIVPTVECNLDCGICYQDRDDTTELPPSIEEMLASYYPFMRELVILGGEPFISRKCVRIVESVNNDQYPDLDLAFITNGTAISQKIINLLAEKRISWILVSVDAATPETYKAIRGGSLSKVIDGVKRLRELREAQEGAWKLIVGFTLMRSNMHEITQFIDLASELGVDFVLTPIFGDWHGENFAPNADEINHLQETLEDLDNYLHLNNLPLSKSARLYAMLSDLKTDV